MDDQAFQLLMAKLNAQDVKLIEIEKKLDAVNQWRWRLEGIRVVIVFLVTILTAKTIG